MHSERVLLVEDDDLVRQILVEYLNELDDADIIAAASASEAVALLDQPLAVLITDLRLGRGMDGRQLAPLARKRRPEISVVLISGDADAIGPGAEPADVVLAKPFGI